MRQIYENRSTQMDEERIAAMVEKKWSGRMIKLPMKNRVDYAFSSEDGILAYAEIKSRKNSIKEYPSFMVALDKWMSARRIAEVSNGVPMFFVVEWTEGVYYLRQDEATYRVGIGGRKDRGDEYDQELCVFVPIEQFKQL